MKPPALPLPELTGFRNAEKLRLMSKILGIALLVQWFVPWFGWIFSWDMMVGAGTFSMLWALLAGAGLTALGFIPAQILKDGLLTVIAAGIGLMGVFSLTGMAGAGPGVVPFLGFFGLMGLVVAGYGLFLWMERGASALTMGLVIGGLSSMAIFLLVPIGGVMPLVFMFKVLGVSGINIIWRIFVLLLFLAYIGLGVLTVMFVVLKRADAAPEWVRLLAWLLMGFPVLAAVLLGIMGMFSSGWSLLAMLHMVVIIGAYLFLLLTAGYMVTEAALDGKLKEMLGLGGSSEA